MADNDGREDFQVDGVYIQERDMNNNGIPDQQEPGSTRFTSEIAGEHASTPPQREALAHLVGSIDTSEFGNADSGYRRTVDAADRLASAAEQAIDGSDDNPGADDSPEGKNYRNARNRLEIERLTRSKPRKSSLKQEMARGRPPATETKHGLEIGLEVLKGLNAGAAHAKQRHQEKRLAEDVEKARVLQLEHAMAEDALANAREDAQRIRGSNEAAADGGPGGSGGPDGSTPPTGTDPTTPGTDPSGPSTDPSSPTPPPVEADPNVRAPGLADGVATPDQDPAAPAAPEPSVVTAEKPSAITASPDKPVGEVDPSKAVGEAGLGAAISVVNPAAGIAATAIQTHESQREANADHGAPGRAVKSRGPEPRNTAPKPERAQTETGERRVVQPTSGTDRSNVVEFRRPEPSRKGGLHAQAEKLDRPNAPVQSRSAPSAPTQRTRSVGLGGPISSFIVSGVRGAESKGAQQDGPDIVGYTYQKQRDGNAASR